MKDKKQNVNWLLFKIFLKASSFTLTGGIAMLPLIKKEVCEKHDLVSDEEIVELIALSHSLPGPIVLNFSIALGRRINRIKGAFAASAAVALPAFLLMLIVAVIFQVIPQDVKVINNIMSGLKAGSAAIILASAWDLGKKSLKSIFAVVILIIAFVLVIFGRDVLIIIIGSGIAGIAFSEIKARKGA